MPNFHNFKMYLEKLKVRKYEILDFFCFFDPIAVCEKRTIPNFVGLTKAATCLPPLSHRHELPLQVNGGKLPSPRQGDSQATASHAHIAKSPR